MDDCKKSHTEVYGEGREAYLCYLKVWDNPYKRDTWEFETWRDGYEDTAARDNI